MAISSSDGNVYESELDLTLSPFIPKQDKPVESNTDVLPKNMPLEDLPSIDVIHEPPTSPKPSKDFDQDPTRNLFLSSGKSTPNKTFIDKLKDTWPVKAVESLVEAFKLPGEVYQGKVDLNSPEGSARASDMALNLMGVGMSAIPMKPGLGIFGGRMSKAAVEQAEKMEKEGFSSLTVKEMTGLERGAEGMWRKEINDSTSVYKTHRLVKDEIIGDKSNYLGNVLEHPDLYKAYPEAQSIFVSKVSKIGDTEALGQFHPKIDTIFVREGLSPKQEKSVILHELQHWIQNKEGFSYSTPDALPPEVVDKYLGYILRKDQNTLRAIKEDLELGAKEGARDKAHNALVDAKFKIYKNQATEVEARNVQTRMDLSKEETRRIPGKFTEDVSRSEQIILQGDEGRVGAAYNSD